MNTEPAVLIGAFVSIVVALGAVFNIVIEATTLTAVIVSVLPIITGLLIRFKVYAPATVEKLAPAPSGQVGSETTLP